MLQGVRDDTRKRGHNQLRPATSRGRLPLWGISEMLGAPNAQESHACRAGRSTGSLTSLTELTELTEQDRWPRCLGTLGTANHVLAFVPDREHDPPRRQRHAGRPDNFDGGSAEKPQIRYLLHRCAASLGPVSLLLRKTSHMPFPSAAGQSLLSKCSSTAFCYLRSAPIWILVIVVLLLGAASTRIGDALVPRRQHHRTKDESREHPE